MLIEVGGPSMGGGRKRDVVSLEELVAKKKMPWKVTRLVQF